MVGTAATADPAVRSGTEGMAAREEKAERAATSRRQRATIQRSPWSAVREEAAARVEVVVSGTLGAMLVLAATAGLAETQMGQ
jgi:hypothetical protein